MTETTQTEAQTETSAEAVVSEPQLSFGTLQALEKIIDVASRRGAFTASEMETVGRSYNELKAFVDARIKLAESESASGESPSTSDKL